MMDNLERSLSILLRRVSSQQVLDNRCNPENIPKKQFIQLMRNYVKFKSEDELCNLYDYLTDTFIDIVDNNDISQNQSGINVFELLKYYSKWLLVSEDYNVHCDYWKMLHWRMMTFDIDETTLVCSYLADLEYFRAEKRKSYGWNAVITHNNKELHHILDQGMCENHSHLKGAAPLFALSWVSLMNNPDQYKELKEFDHNPRSTNLYYAEDYRQISLVNACTQAALIRIYLYAQINKKDNIHPIREQLIQKQVLEHLRNSAMQESNELLLNELLTEVKFFGMDVYPDYAIAGAYENGVQHDERLFPYIGERWLMYQVFSDIYSGRFAGTVECKLFYAYLLIKERIRSELVQNNDIIGFENFQQYQSRKSKFLKSSFFENEQVAKAIQVGMFESNVLTYEARLAPMMSSAEYAKAVNDLDRQVNYSEYGNRIFYGIHFIKEKDEDRFAERMCRHYNLRKTVEKQAVALHEFRTLDEYRDIAGRIRLIDAANSEIGCGPEVFAQAYRYLSKHMIETEETERVIPQLKRTYHVGEDFLDMISGLRSVDEVIRFLSFNCGDRIGHGVVLGLNPDVWYDRKNNRFLMSQQEYLDNLAWMHHCIQKYSIDCSAAFTDYLNSEFNYYFEIVYERGMSDDEMRSFAGNGRRRYEGMKYEAFYNYHHYSFNIDNYYEAWKLRSDDPELYIDGYFNNLHKIYKPTREYSYYNMNGNLPHRKNIRYMQEIALLYYYYHYDRHVRNEGKRIIEKKVGYEYIEVVKKIQAIMRERIALRGISIETNPSSNFLISQLKRYAEHPIVTFYNQMLQPNANGPQINVSINTDDAGIFSTSLENEYSYLALALEKEKDENGRRKYARKDIYRWLDEIRKMGIEQTFLRDEELKKAIRNWHVQAEKDHIRKRFIFD